MAKLTPEELHLKRSEAAKRAAQTLKQREAQDAEFHARMQAIRLANLSKGRMTQQRLRQERPEEYRRRASERAKKAAETVRRKRAENPEYNRRYLESHRQATERIRRINEQRAEIRRKEEERRRDEEENNYYDWLYEEQQKKEELEKLKEEAEREAEERRKQEQEKQEEEELKDQEPYDSLFDYTEPEEEEQEEFDTEAYEEARQEYGDEADVRDYLPTEAGSIIDTLKTILSAGINVNTSHYLLDMMEDEINFMDGETREEQEANFAQRIKSASDSLITAATDVAFEPSDQAKLYNNAVFFADLISGGNNEGFSDTSIREMASLDIPFDNSKSNRYFHV